MPATSTKLAQTSTEPSEIQTPDAAPRHPTLSVPSTSGVGMFAPSRMSQRCQKHPCNATAITAKRSLRTGPTRRLVILHLRNIHQHPLSLGCPHFGTSCLALASKRALDGFPGLERSRRWQSSASAAARGLVQHSRYAEMRPKPRDKKQGNDVPPPPPAWVSMGPRGSRQRSCLEKVG